MKQQLGGPLRVLAWPSGSPNDLNPYVRLMYEAFRPPAAVLIPYRASMLNVPGADIFHMQWPEAIFWGVGRHNSWIASLLAFNILRTASQVRRRGGRVVQTIHNLDPHAQLPGRYARVWQRYRSALLARTDLLIGLTDSSLEQFRTALPAAAHLPSVIVPHPHYRKAYPARPDREAARKDLNLAGTGFFMGVIGSVRSSKNVPQTILAFKTAADTTDRLLVAGACEDHKLWNQICSIAGDDSRISLSRKHLSEAEIGTAIAACDAIVLNQSTTLNSGTALLALSLDRPVIAPAQGSMVEVARTIGTKWVALFEAPLDGPKLKACLAYLRDQRRTAEAPLSGLDPSTLSERLLRIFKEASSRASIADCTE